MLVRLALVGLLLGAGWYGYSTFVSDEIPVALQPIGGSGQQDADTPPGPGGDSRPQFVASVQPTWGEGGEVYRVRPTRRGRMIGPDELRTAWRQAVERGVPNRQGLRHQFYCHPLSIIARAKRTWDLETWRPNVGLERTMLSGCNP